MSEFQWGPPAKFSKRGFETLNDAGQKHNESGPAVKWSDGSIEYWINGVQITENEFRHRFG